MTQSVKQRPQKENFEAERDNRTFPSRKSSLFVEVFSKMPLEYVV